MERFTAKQNVIRNYLALFALLVVSMLIFAGCGSSGGGSETIAEGVIFSVEYEMEGGRTGGFTRLNNAKAVPGGNGSWNVDAHGRLTREFLIITRPQIKDLGPLVIPARRLVKIQFGDGGITKVNESEPKPAN
jgi:hypothetical protein